MGSLLERNKVMQVSPPASPEIPSLRCQIRAFGLPDSVDFPVRHTEKHVDCQSKIFSSKPKKFRFLGGDVENQEQIKKQKENIYLKHVQSGSM